MVENRRTYLKKWENSQGVMIPKNVLTELGIQDYKNQELELYVVDQELIVKKVNYTSRLMMKFHRLLDQNKNNLEYDFGQPLGKENY
ncbi:AbrB/MazE/SpoVT family DNA-binding domain-containing protein [Companilactobacillus muriivasis]|uniref:AbrB/MazE/SpoVT family DNA-binding domain-containing protein n=1 Tax=Companilactobacillus muriivasis TaxID=3081444 RepID=UPI0030C683C1